MASCSNVQCGGFGAGLILFCLAVVLVISDQALAPRWDARPAVSASLRDSTCDYAFDVPQTCAVPAWLVWADDGRRIEACNVAFTAYESESGGWTCDSPPARPRGGFFVAGMVALGGGALILMVASALNFREECKQRT